MGRIPPYLVSPAIAKIATIIYDQHDMPTRIELPNRTLWVTVPEGAILHIGDLALYHLNPDQYDGKIKISDFYSKQSLELDANRVTQLQYEGVKTIDVSPVENVSKEIASYNKPPLQTLSYAWSGPNTVITVMVALGYLLTFGIAYLYFRRAKALKGQINKWTARLRKRRKPDQTQNTNDLVNLEEETDLGGSRISQIPTVLGLVSDYQTLRQPN